MKGTPLIKHVRHLLDPKGTKGGRPQFLHINFGADRVALQMEAAGFALARPAFLADHLRTAQLNLYRGGADWDLGKVSKNEFEDEEREILLLEGALEYFLFPEDVVIALSACLKPGGLLIIVSSKRGPVKLGAFTAYSERKKRKSLLTGFQSAELKKPFFRYGFKHLGCVLPSFLLNEASGALSPSLIRFPPYYLIARKIQSNSPPQEG